MITDEWLAWKHNAYDYKISFHSYLALIEGTGKYYYTYYI